MGVQRPRANSVKRILASCVAMGMLACESRARADGGTVIYKTPAGVNDRAGHPVSATISITPTPTGLTVQITNTTPHMINFEQCISSVSFTLKNGEGANLGGSSGYARIVYVDGIYTADQPDDTHWKLERAGARINICSPGKTYNVIAECPGKKYPEADDSLLREPGRNPFLSGTPSFQVVIPKGGNVQVVDISVGWGSGSACCGDDTYMIVTPDTAWQQDVGNLFGDLPLGGYPTTIDAGTILAQTGVGFPPYSSSNPPPMLLAWSPPGTTSTTPIIPISQTEPGSSLPAPPYTPYTPIIPLRPFMPVTPLTPTTSTTPATGGSPPPNPPVTPPTPPRQPNVPSTGQTIPEPSTLVMLSVAGLGFLARRKRLGL